MQLVELGADSTEADARLDGLLSEMDVNNTETHRLCDVPLLYHLRVSKDSECKCSGICPHQ